MEAVILLVAVYALSLTLLYLAEMMWWVYQHTPVGSRFLVEFGDRAHAINTIMALEFWRFAGKITVSAFIICTGVSAISWFFPIGRNFYDPMGFWAKLMFWGLPLSAAVSFYISEALDFSSIEIMLVFTVVPTMCLFMSCFNYTERLVPEMGDIISEGCRFAKECTAFIKDKIEKG